MKALSIWQPYASLIAINAKQYETRSWATKYRGPIAIHAAAKSPAAVYKILDSDVVGEIEKALAPLGSMTENIGHLRAKCLPLGKVIAIAYLTDCVEITPAFAASVSAEERTFGDWTPGRYAWKLENVSPLPFFIQAKGQQGIWNFQSDKINEKGEYTPMSAQSDYKAAAAALEKFCNEETNFAVEILTENYPLSVKFTPNAQMSLFDSENYTVDENGEIGNILISVGQSTRVLSTLRFKMDAKLMKKMIKLSEKVGNAYLHAFREGAQFAPAAIEKATDLFVDELWKTCIPDTSVVIFNSRKYKQALNTVLKSVLSGDEVKIPEDLPEPPPRKYRADISLYNLFPTNADESPDDRVGADIAYFAEGEDLEAVRDEAVNQIANVCLSRGIPAGQSFGVVLTLSCNDEHVDTDEGSAMWDGAEVHIEI